MNIKHFLSVAALLCAVPIAIHAQARPFKIDAGAAATTLNEFSKQARLQVLFDSDDVRGLKTRAIDGELEPPQALVRMLDGTDFEFEFVNARTVAVKRRGTPAPAGAIPASAQTGPTGDMRLVRAGHPTAEPDRKPESAQSTETGADSRGVPEMLVEGKRTLNADIERTEDATQPYVVFGSEEIQRSQAINLEEFLRTRLPMNTAAGTEFTGGSNSSSTINLRGLGDDQTLILVDGRRMPGRGSQNAPGQPDINGIPLASVERIEVLPSTAGGIYGGSATGGVINIVLRRDFRGIEARANYLNTFDTDAGAMRFDLSGGFSLEGGRTRVMITATHSDANNLTVGDRDFAARALKLQLKNNAALVTGSSTPPLGATVNIISNTISAGVRQPLTLKSTFGGAALGKTTTHIPLGYAGPASDNGAALVANAGSYNLDMPSGPTGRERGLVPAPSLESASLNVRREFGERFEVFVDAATLGNTGSSFSGQPPNSVSSIPVSSPFNPFNQIINVRFPTPGLVFPTHTESETVRATAGIIARLSGGWTAELDYGWSRSRFETVQTSSVVQGVVNTLLRTGLPGSNGRPALNALQEGNTFPIDFSSYLLPTPNFFSNPSTVLKDATVRLSGPAAQLPGGAVTVSMLAARRMHEGRPSLNGQINATTGNMFYFYYPTRNQDTDSVYVEARAPLISASNARRGIRELEVQVSARHDRYRTRGEFGTTVLQSLDAPLPPIDYNITHLQSTDYTLGLRYAPTESVAFRASFGTGFLPPSVIEISPTREDGYFSLGTDPKRGDTEMYIDGDPEIYGSDSAFDWIQGGNPGLKAEDSESWSAGVIFTPSFARGARLSIDYTRIEKINEIQYPDWQFVLNNEALFPGRIVRGPKRPQDDQEWEGLITYFDTSLMNIARTRVDAFDIQADYLMETAGSGSVRWYSIVTWQPHYKNQTLPTAPVVDSVGFNLGPLEWRGNVGFDWERGPVTVSWNTQYYHSYFVYDATAAGASRTVASLNQGSPTIPRQIYHDLIASYRFNGASSPGGMLADSEISFGVQNLFDTSPPIIASTATTSPGYSTYGDPRLRRYSISFRKSFGN